MFTIEFDHLTDFGSFTVNKGQTLKLVNLKISAEVQVCDLGQNLKMTKTSKFCSIYQENTSKSCFQLNLIIFTDFQSFAVNEEKLQN